MNVALAINELESFCNIKISKSLSPLSHILTQRAHYLSIAVDIERGRVRECDSMECLEMLDGIERVYSDVMNELYKLPKEVH